MDAAGFQGSDGMAGINFSGMLGANNYSTLFNSLNSGSSSNIAGSNMLSDWASLKNGSYSKLVKSYYKLPEKDLSANKNDKSENSALLRANSEVKSDANDLKSSISALADSKSLFTDKITTKDANGNEVMDYDRQKIGKAVKSFVDSYNSMIKSGGDSDNNAVLRNTLSMVTNTSRNAALLSKAGISIGEGNTLSIDSEALNKANIDDLKSIFSGAGSFVSSLESNVSNIEYAVNAENNRFSNYTMAGTYNNISGVGNMYEGLF